MTDTDVLQSDLRDMLRALGKFDGARPESPHEVFRECIADAIELRAENKRLRAALMDALALVEMAYGETTEPGKTVIAASRAVLSN